MLFLAVRATCLAIVINVGLVSSLTHLNESCDEQNGTCVLHWSSPLEKDDSLALVWAGDVNISDGVRIKSRGGSVEFNVTGSLRLGSKSGIESDAAVAIDVDGLWADDNSFVKSHHGMVVIGGSACSDGIHLKGLTVQLQGRSVSFHCPGGVVKLSSQGGSVVAGMENDSDPNPSWGESWPGRYSDLKDNQIKIEALSVRLTTPATTLIASRVFVDAYGNAHVSATIKNQSIQFRRGPPAEGSLPPADGQVELYMRANGSLHLGWTDAKWEVKFIWAFGANVTLESGLEIRAQGLDSCANRDSQPIDKCPPLLSAWPGAPTGALFKEQDVKFDVMLVANESLIMSNNSIVSGSSIMICAREKLDMMVEARVDASGRGCPAGVGASDQTQPGESPRFAVTGDPDSEDAACSAAGGGGNVGRGGRGMRLHGGKYRTCAHGGDGRYRLLPPEADWRLLPTAGAAGGGRERCRPPRCEDVPKGSTGGGLVWLSAGNLVLQNGVIVEADGLPGKIVTVEGDKKLATGGGAGGQVLMFARKVSVEASSKDNVPKLSASGGDASCSNNMFVLSGGGGGGFLGLSSGNGTIQAHEPLQDRISVRASGGVVPHFCTFLLKTVPKWMNEDVSGTQGLTVSLVKCHPGSFGLFCQPCPIGTWSADARSCNQCRTRNNNSVYTTNGLDNDDCPYECRPGVPNVSENPDCKCKPGYGEYNCRQCEIGSWSDGFSCKECMNKPPQSQSIYTAAGWSNETCPFKCSAGVPDVQVNPKCLSSATYFALSFGSVKAIFAVLLCVLQAVSVFVCYLKRRKRRVGQSAQVGGSAPFVKASSAEGARAGVLFSRAQLPYHICRVYLSGANCASSPWGLNERPPAEVGQLLVAAAWAQMVMEANQSSKIGRWGPLFELMLTVLYPPAASLHALSQRQKRAAKLWHLVNAFSEGLSCKPVIWRPLHSSDSNPAALFGCDEGATLGYIDFFDFARNRFDWEPPDFRKEARLLVAHGHGSFSEPLSISVDDPLVHHLASSGFGDHAVYHVVLTFNRLARRLPKEELSRPSASDRSALELLKKTVEQCAASCGISSAVQVVMLQQSGPSFSRSAARQASNPVGGSTSFNDLIRELSQDGSTSDEKKDAEPSTDTKLCLLFMDALAYQEASQQTPKALRASWSEGVGPSSEVRCTLTSPIRYDQLARARPLHFKPMSIEVKFPEDDACGCASRLQDCMISWAPPLPFWASLLGVLVLQLIDAMVQIIEGHVLQGLGWGPVIAWMLVLPLVPLLCPVAGLGFVLLESPRLGRASVTMQVMSVVNAAVFLNYCIEPYAGAVLIMFLLKLALCCFLVVHACNLENRHDERCTQTKDTSFVDEITGAGADGLGARPKFRKRLPKRLSSGEPDSFAVQATSQASSGQALSSWNHAQRSRRSNDHDGDVCMTSLRSNSPLKHMPGGLQHASPF